MYITRWIMVDGIRRLCKSHVMDSMLARCWSHSVPEPGVG